MDYRKFGESPSGQKYITSYRILKDMFSERFESDKSICSNNYYENGQMLKKANDASYFAASGIWYKRYENTIAENKEIFQEFINLINRINPDIKIAVVTYPYCQKFLEVNKEYVSNLQKEFYEIINSTKGCENIKIFEHLFLGKGKKCFFQLCLFIFLSIYIAAANAGNVAVGWCKLLLDFGNLFFVHVYKLLL